MTSPADKRRDYNLKRRYNITAEEYEAILLFQQGRCPICGRPPKDGQRRFSVDHDHGKETGLTTVRGICCYACNKYRVGNMTLSEAKAVYEYLLNPPAIQVIGQRLAPLSTGKKRRPRKRPRKTG